MQLTDEGTSLRAVTPDVGARPEADPVGHLIDDARTGSVAAFERLYRALAGQVTSYLRWHRVTDPDGLTNDVFAQVHRNLGRFNGDEAGFRSWVFTIAHHRMIDDRRRANRQPRVDREAGIDQHANTGDVEDDAFAVLGGDWVRSLLAVLSPDQRDVVLLRIVADQSVEEAARLLGKRAGAVKALQHRALAALRRQLDHDAAAI